MKKCQSDTTHGAGAERSARAFVLVGISAASTHGTMTCPNLKLWALQDGKQV